MKTIDDQINEYLVEAEEAEQKTYDLAIVETIRLAREILKKDDRLDEFMMACGSWGFTKKVDHTASSGFTNWAEKDPTFKESVQPMVDFMKKWKNIKLVGESMKFTADGELVKYW